MLDQGLVRSGFDAEILLGERQLSYLILTLIDAGAIPTIFHVGDPPKAVRVRGPAAIDRTYEPLADAALPEPVDDSLHPAEVEILFEHATGGDVRVHVVVDLTELVNVPIAAEVGVDLFVALALRTERDEAGLLTSAKLDVTLLDFDSPLLSIASDFGVDKATILATLKAAVDRQVDLGSIGAFKRLQDLAFRKLEADGEHAAAIGLYVNLRLQDGPDPESLLGARGNLDDARNFLPAGSDAAMASRAALFGDVATDAFQRFAEIDDDGNVTYPWHKSINNKKSKVIGKIKGVSAGPMPSSPSSNTLRIDVTLEYEIDNFFDPDAHLVIELTPVTNDQGVLVWNANVDFHASLLLELIGLLVLASLFTGIGGIVGLSLAAAIAGGFIAGSLVDALGHFIVDEVYSGRVEAKVNAGIPDVVSGRVEVAQRRWDPFYTTHHQVAMRPEGVVINNAGVALWGKAVVDKRIEPLVSAVIRDKQVQSPSPPTHLRYRIADADEVRDDFTSVAPGTDRREFAQHDPAGEPTLFQLGIEQIVARIAEGRILADLAYIAKRVDVRQHQAHGILTISNRELNEQRDALIGAFEDATRTAIETEQGDEIRDQVAAEFEVEGVTPTPEDFEERVQERIDAILAPLRDEFVAGPLGTQLEEALRPLLRFDLPPENLAALQKKKILHLLDLEIITRHDGFMYYRDHPDFFKPDNLLSLPHYRATPEGPVLL